MSKELESLLYEYLGQLQYEKENCFDYSKDFEITSKINSVHKLLNIDEEKPTSFFKVISSLKFKIN